MLNGGYGEHWVFLLMRKYEAPKKKQVFLNIDILLMLDISKNDIINK